MFLETNSALKVDPHKDVMDPTARHRALNQLGFRLLDFPYVQPPLSIHQAKCKDLVLAVHVGFLRQTNVNEPAFFVADIVLQFMKEFFGLLVGLDTLEHDVDFKNMIKFVEDHPMLAVVEPGSC